MVTNAVSMSEVIGGGSVSAVAEGILLKKLFVGQLSTAGFVFGNMGALDVGTVPATAACAATRSCI